MSNLEEQFLLLIRADKLPEPQREYRFDPKRRWKFDFAWLDKKVAVEIEGGVWVNGRHNRGKGFIGDCEKYNQAVIQGWRILRYTAETINVEDLKILLDMKTKIENKKRDYDLLKLKLI